MNYSPQKIYYSYFNALSIMKAFSLTLVTDHDSAQLCRKAIITPKAFSFHQKKDSPFPLNFITWPQDDRCKLKKASALRPLGLLLFIIFDSTWSNIVTMTASKFDFAFYRLTNSGPRPLWRIDIGSIGYRLEQRFSSATKARTGLLALPQARPG